MKTSNIRKILVVGAGTMGHGLAQVFASGGYTVGLVDLDASALSRASTLIRSNLGVMADAGVLPSEKIDPIINRIETSTDLELTGASADLAIEAVTEDPQVKRDVFARLDRACPAHCILLSNTSSLNVFRIVEVSQPERFCIAHWYAPPHLIPLVDVVKGPHTSQATCDLVVGILAGLGKKPVVLERFIPGYLVNRLQVALNREVNFLLDNGYATPQQLDEAVKASLAPRMMVLGVVRRMDFTGLDVSLAIQKRMVNELTNQVTFETLQRLVDQGHWGVKTGHGFYDYTGKTPEEIQRERDLALLKLLRQPT